MLADPLLIAIPEGQVVSETFERHRPSLEAIPEREVVEVVSQTLERHRCNYTVILTIVMSTVISTLGPLALVRTIQPRAENLEDCNGDGIHCTYAKVFDDGVLPSVGFQMFPIKNGVGSPYTPDIVDVHAASHCPNIPTTTMKASCSHGDTKARVEDSVSRRPSGIVFLLAISCRGAARIVHDILVATFHRREDFIENWRVWILASSFASTVALGVSAVAAVMWSMGTAELFYAPLGERCGCYYRFNAIGSLMALAIPATLSWQYRSDAANYIREYLAGPYLMSHRDHVPIASFDGVCRSFDPMQSLLMRVRFPSNKDLLDELVSHRVLADKELQIEEWSYEAITGYAVPCGRVLQAGFVLMLVAWNVAVSVFMMRAVQLVQKLLGLSDSGVVAIRCGEWAGMALVIFDLCCIAYVLKNHAVVVSLRKRFRAQCPLLERRLFDAVKGVVGFVFPASHLIYCFEMLLLEAEDAKKVINIVPPGGVRAVSREFASFWNAIDKTLVGARAGKYEDEARREFRRLPKLNSSTPRSLASLRLLLTPE